MSWNEIINLERFNLTIKGHSRGSEKTGFYLPQLKLFLDAGIQSYYEPEFILITHGHMDHAFALPMLLTGIHTHPQIYVPWEHETMFKTFVNATYQLSQGDAGLISQYPILGVKGGQVINLSHHYMAVVYELDHTVPCRGYGLYLNKTKLKQEYLHLSSQQLVDLKNHKVTITEVIREPVMAYLTDTAVTIFQRYPELLTYPYLIVECTFLHDETKEGQHIGWSELKPLIEQHPEIIFILIHFSIRYTDDEIRQHFASQHLSNIIVVGG